MRKIWRGITCLCWFVRLIIRERCCSVSAFFFFFLFNSLLLYFTLLFFIDPPVFVLGVLCWCLCLCLVFYIMCLRTLFVLFFCFSPVSLLLPYLPCVFILILYKCTHPTYLLTWLPYFTCETQYLLFTQTNLMEWNGIDGWDNGWMGYMD